MKREQFAKTEKDAGSQRGKKTLWQMIFFLLVSCIASVIQLVLVNVLLLLMRDWKAPLPTFLTGIFNASTVGTGNDNWGYVLPFFLSNLTANIYGYIHNKKTTFKSDAPTWCFVVYLAVMIALILFTTWLQGIVTNAIEISAGAFFVSLAPTIAAALAGFIQMLILFPLEKFVLFRKRNRS